MDCFLISGLVNRLKENDPLFAVGAVVLSNAPKFRIFFEALKTSGR